MLDFMVKNVNTNLRAKFINEQAGNIFKGKSKEDIIKDLGEHGPLYSEIVNSPQYKELNKLGFYLIASKRQLDNGTVKFESTTPIKLKQSNVTEISFRLENGGYFRVNGNPMYKWENKPTIREALEYTIDWIKEPKKTQLHGEEIEFKIKTDETYNKLTQVRKEWENKLKTFKGKKMTGRMEFYGEEWYSNPRSTKQENRLWVQNIMISEDGDIFVKNGDYYFRLLPNVTYIINDK
jgi:hypothetical protein